MNNGNIELTTAQPTSAEPATTPSPTTETRAFAAPPVDVYESKESFLLIAELPGVRSEDVEISLEKGELTLEARRGDQPLDFRRRFALSLPVDADRVSARLEHGVLRVELPKAEEAKPRTIPVVAG